MKKVLIFSVLTVLSFHYSCEKAKVRTSKESNTNKEVLEKSINQSELKSKITVSTSTDLITDVFYKMGVSGIEVKGSNDQLMYSFNTLKTFGISGKDIDLAEYPITFDGTELFFNNKTDIKVSLQDGKPYIRTSDYQGIYKDLKDDQVSLEIEVLILFMNEITTSNEIKKTFDDTAAEYDQLYTAISGGGGCSFWNTYYVFSAGASSAVAQNGLPSEIAHYGMSNCSSIGGVDTSCVFDNHLCVSTQAFCC